jgi:hypothetical protein
MSRQVDRRSARDAGDAAKPGPFAEPPGVPRRVHGARDELWREGPSHGAVVRVRVEGAGSAPPRGRGPYPLERRRRIRRFRGSSTRNQRARFETDRPTTLRKPPLGVPPWEARAEARRVSVERAAATWASSRTGSVTTIPSELSSNPIQAADDSPQSARRGAKDGGSTRAVARLDPGSASRFRLRLGPARGRRRASHGRDFAAPLARGAPSRASADPPQPITVTFPRVVGSPAMGRSPAG